MSFMKVDFNWPFDFWKKCDCNMIRATLAESQRSILIFVGTKSLIKLKYQVNIMTLDSTVIENHLYKVPLICTFRSMFDPVVKQIKIVLRSLVNYTLRRHARIATYQTTWSLNFWF